MTPTGMEKDEAMAERCRWCGDEGHAVVDCYNWKGEITQVDILHALDLVREEQKADAVLGHCASVLSVEHDDMATPFDRFCDELDALLEHWRGKPADDQVSAAEVSGALQFRCFTLFRQVEESS